MKTNDFSPLIGEKFDRERTFKLMNSYPIAGADAIKNPLETSMPIAVRDVFYKPYIESAEVTGRSDKNSNVILDAIKSRARWLPGEE
jgi:hypothetical protein